MPPFTWTNPNTDANSKIQKLYYAYSLEDSPPIYVLFAQMKDGSMKKFSTLDPNNYPYDKPAFEAAKGNPFEIPLPVPTPKSKANSCTIC